MKYLITGGSGFIGIHLTKYLIQHGHSVGILYLNQPIASDEIQDNIEKFIGDITDIKFIEKVILNYKPNIIFHLAAQSLPKISWEQPILTMQVNIIGSLNILEVLKINKLSTKLIIFGSSSEYKQNPNGCPISENDTLEASSPYAISKIAADNLSLLYAKVNKINAIVVRPFFVIGSIKENDVCSDFARKIVNIELNQQSNLKVGNIEPIRDFIDVRDAINALLIIAEKGIVGEIYNICTGEGHSINQIVNIYKNFAKKSFDIEYDLSLLRPLDENIKIGNPEKIKNLGWIQKYSLEETLQEILNFWRDK